MKVKVRTSDGTVHAIDKVKKSMMVEAFRKLVFEAVGIPAERQRLLFRGKQLEDGCDLLDYRIDVGFIIDVTEKVIFDEEKKKTSTKLEDKVEEIFTDEREPDEESSSVISVSSSAAATRDDPAQNITQLRQICPELAQELEGEDYDCKTCGNNPRRKCKECGCTVCGGKEPPEELLMCDECTYYTHMKCCDPPLQSIPDDDWYCKDCFNPKNQIVNVGEKGSKFSKKNAKMPSRQKGVKKEWGGGHATAGRTKTCQIVPNNHFGHIPGIEVGMCWKYRMQLSEEGVHRPPVSGIAGKGEEGCYSIVLAGGYEDDTDDGNEFFYTGCGGRDLSGNKRTAEQSFDQVLEKMNLAIARNCDAPVDKEKGNEAKDWRKGKPIRVVRSAKMTHSKFAPKEGNRYDGLYKVVKYWPEKGRSGFIVWRYLMRRDDPKNKAPWEKGAKKFDCIFPEGYEEEKDKKKDKAGGKKRPAEDNGDDGSAGASSKKKKVNNGNDHYVVEDHLSDAILADTKNSKLWKECLDFKAETKHVWYQKVTEALNCVVCQGLLDKPVTLPCSHNLCQDCLVRSFKAEVYTCAYCRYDLGKNFKAEVNLECAKAIKVLFS